MDMVDIGMNTVYIVLVRYIVNIVQGCIECTEWMWWLVLRLEKVVTVLYGQGIGKYSVEIQRAKYYVWLWWIPCWHVVDIFMGEVDTWQGCGGCCIWMEFRQIPY